MYTPYIETEYCYSPLAEEIFPSCEVGLWWFLHTDFITSACGRKPKNLDTNRNGCLMGGRGCRELALYWEVLLIFGFHLQIGLSRIDSQNLGVDSDITMSAMCGGNPAHHSCSICESLVGRQAPHIGSGNPGYVPTHC